MTALGLSAYLFDQIDMIKTALMDLEGLVLPVVQGLVVPHLG